MTCTLFSYIIEKVMNSKNKVCEVPISLTHMMMLQYINNNNKFVHYDNYIKNKTAFMYSPDEYREFFFKLQKIYFSIIKLKQLVKHKYYKKYDYDCDLIGNQLSTFKEKHVITIIENETLYTFSVKDLINNIYTSITDNAGMFWEPKYPTNPYTGLPISKHNLYNIFFKYKETNIYTNFPLEYFFLSEFNMELFKKTYEGIMNSSVIENSVRNLTTDEFRMKIREMFRLFNQKPPYLAENFPSERIKEIFTPYLNLYYHYKFGQDENRIYHSKILLRQQIKRFVIYLREHNPKFGRVILVPQVKPGSRKRKYIQEPLDDCVRWDQNYPYIKENKPTGFDIVRNNLLSENSSQTVFGNNLFSENSQTVIENDSDDDSDDDSDATLDINTTDDTHDTPIFNGDFVVSHDLSLNDTPQRTTQFTRLSNRDRSVERDLFTTALNFLNRRRETSINDEIVNSSSISSVDELNLILNNGDNQPIHRANLDIARNSIMTYIIQLRLMNTQGTRVEDNAITLIDTLLSKQLEVIVGKLLLSYIGREIDDDVSRQVVREILAEPFLSRDENEHARDGYNALRQSMHSLYESIVVDTNDLSNNIV
jgi:hypothetical protein